MSSSERVCDAVLAQSLTDIAQGTSILFTASLDPFNPGNGLVSTSTRCAAHHCRCLRSSLVHRRMMYRFATCTIPVHEPAKFSPVDCVGGPWRASLRALRRLRVGKIRNRLRRPWLGLRQDAGADRYADRVAHEGVGPPFGGALRALPRRFRGGGDLAASTADHAGAR